MLRAVLLANLLILCCLFLKAQTTSTSLNVHQVEPVEVPLFTENPNFDRIEFKDYLKEVTPLTLNAKHLDYIVQKRPQNLVLTLPQANGTAIKVALKQSKVISKDFKVRTSDQKSGIDYQPGVYYQGEVINTGKSLAAISFFEDMVMGVLSFGGDNYVLGHLDQNTFPASTDYVLYKESDMLIPNNFSCANDELLEIPTDALHTEEGNQKGNSLAKVVKVYFEADHKLYTDKGSNSTNVTNYVTGLYNVVIALYAADQVETEISEIFVWTTPDPYPSSGSSAAMNAFQDRLNGNYNGDLAHLLSTTNNNNGGIAYVGVLCNKYYGVAYSNIGNSYSQLPNYSWTVEVVTHEMGHNLGSPHTQSCTWPGGAIDNCYPVEGNCAPGPAPTNGGTIMSYCHLGGPGINFNNGFGPLPGDRIRSRIASANCLDEGSGGGNGGGNTGTPNLTAGTDNLNINGTNVTITHTVENNGDGDATASTVTYFLTLDTNINGSDPVLGSRSIPALTAGQTSSSINFSIDVATLNLTPGDYIVAYVIDSGTAVSESNEQDNVFGWVDNKVTIEASNNGDNYCVSEANSTQYEWISMVKVGDLEHNSGNDNGYAYIEDMGNLSIGTDLAVELRPSYSGAIYEEYWRIWIDLNQDGDFNDSGEMVYDPGAAANRVVTDFINIPLNATLGLTRMRVSMKGSTDLSSPASCETFDFGEVEDYEINLVAGQLPLTLTAFNGSTTENYNLLEWFTATEEETVYHYLERSENGKNDFKIIERVQAAGYSQNTIQYVAKDKHPLPSAYYRLRTENKDGTSDISRLLFLERTAEKPLKLTRLYPVPVQDELTIQFSSPKAGSTLLRLTDFTGRIVKQQQFTATTDNNEVQLNVQEFSAGIYFLVIENEHGSVSQKVVINN